MYDDNTASKPETINYTGPSAKDRAKKFFKLETVKEVNEDGVSLQGSMDSNTAFARRYDEERQSTNETEGEEDVEVPELSLPTTVGLLVVVTVLVAVTAEWLVDSIDGLASGGGISKEFIGLILLPIVGNAAEHVSAVTVSVKDKLTLSISVAVGSSIVSFLSRQRDTINSFHPANRVVCHPILHRTRVDHWSSAYDALRPIRVGRAFFGRLNGQLRRARREIQLVGRNDLTLFVRLNLHPVRFSFGADMRVGMSSRLWCFGSTPERS